MPGPSCWRRCPGFYHQPKSIGDLVDFVVARICDQLGVENDPVPRWGASDGRFVRASRLDRLRELQRTQRAQEYRNMREMPDEKRSTFLSSILIFFVPVESFVVLARFFIAFGECICSD